MKIILVFLCFKSFVNIFIYVEKKQQKTESMSCSVYIVNFMEKLESRCHQQRQIIVSAGSPTRQSLGIDLCTIIMRAKKQTIWATVSVLFGETLAINEKMSVMAII